MLYQCNIEYDNKYNDNNITYRPNVHTNDNKRNSNGDNDR